MLTTKRLVVATPLVVDASAVVELLRRSALAVRVEQELRGAVVAVPAHFDAEVFSALGRLVRVGDLDAALVGPMLTRLAQAPFRRYGTAGLLHAAWALRHNVTQRDALYVVLARQLRARLVTTDARLSQAPRLGIALTLVS